MFEKRSKLIFISAIIATLYSIIVILYFIAMYNESATSSSSSGGGFVILLLSIPTIAMVIGTLLNWLGFWYKKPAIALISAIIYFQIAGIIAFTEFAVYLIPIIVLGFVGYINQKKINNADNLITN